MALTVGDPITARYELRDPITGQPGDATVAVAVTRPDGTAQPTVTPTRVSTGVYDAAWAADLPGVWRWMFTAVGALADTTEGAAYVWPAATVVPWVPDRRQVAKYIPQRTIPADQSSDLPGLDFGALTTPTDGQADDHVAAGVAWVQARTGPLAAALYAEAAETAAVRAAGMIELAYPVRDGDINTAEQLLAQAALMLDALVEANEDAGGDPTDPDDPGIPGHVMPQWAFPVPVEWGDRLLF